MKDLLKKITGARENDDYPPKQQRQKIIWLVGAIVLGITLLFIGNSNRPAQSIQDKTTGETGDQRPGIRSAMAQEEEILADRLKKMLGQVEGAGKVEVIVRLASSKRDRYALNTNSGRKTTEEKDQAGGARLITENTGNEQLVLLRNGQKETPVVEEEQAARVAGILVVAEGARDPGIKAHLFQAAQIALGVEPHKILVLPAGGGE
jgi:stage III sporulation protein AG